MFDYLINYGVKKHSVNYEDIDINDRLILQDQINKARKNYFDMIQLLDDVQSRYLAVSQKIAKVSKDLIVNAQGVRSNSIFSTDDEYLGLEAEQQALKAGMSIVNEQIDYYKNDLRILNSVFYNKF